MWSLQKGDATVMPEESELTPEGAATEYVPPEGFYAVDITSKKNGIWLCKFAQIGEACPLGRLLLQP